MKYECKGWWCCRLEKTAIVLCDVIKDDHSLAPHAPRSILRNQIKAAQAIGAFVPMAASELEYFLYQDTYEEAKVDLLWCYFYFKGLMSCNEVSTDDK